MTDIIWKEPPPAPRGRAKGPRNTGKGHDFAQTLKQHPGRWAYYGAHKAARTASNLELTYGLEATVRKREDGAWDVYARYPEAG